MGTKMYFSILVTVSFISSVLSFSERVIAQRGNNLEFSCNHTTQKKPVWAFYKESKPLKRENVSFEINDVHNLILTNITGRYSGKFVCFENYKKKKIASEHYLTVIKDDITPSIQRNLIQKKTVFVGDSVTLPCNTSNTRLGVEWQFDSDSWFSEEYLYGYHTFRESDYIKQLSMPTLYNLVISNLRQKNIGIYTCIDEDGLGIIIEEYHITVEKKPTKRELQMECNKKCKQDYS
jgi:Immunoglobulin I-set domain